MTQLPFIPDHIYKRGDIHTTYGGNRQSGICPSTKYPFIFIFSGKSGQQHGYRDGWDNPNVFSYTGAGQVGDMQFIAGNLALRDHLQNGKRVFLFESEGNGFVKFISELECFDVDEFPTHDTNGNIRKGIKFFFKRKGAHLPAQPGLFKPLQPVAESIESYNKLPAKTKLSVTSRIGDGVYLKRIIHRWEYKCAVTGFDKLNLLIASNIEPWPEDDQPERQDIDNGILLSPTYDALFEQHLISFEDSGKIILSKAIEMQAFKKIGVSGKETIKGLNDYNLIYLDKHRLRFYETH
jgi:hypothetical protein